MSDARRPAPTANLMLRCVTRLITARHGQKGKVARQLAAECGRNWRSLYYWRMKYRKFDAAGLIRKRSDRGITRVYTPQQLDLISQAAKRVGRHGDVAREWKRLALGVGTFETFRFWVRRLQLRPDIAQREARSA
jgi:transposase-like protein